MQCPTVVHAENGYGTDMADTLPDARKTLAANLSYLMETTLDDGLKTDVGVAKRCGGGMSYKTVERMRLGKGTSPPNFGNIVAVAHVFGLQAWQLLKPRENNPGRQPLVGGSEVRRESQGTSASIAQRKTKRN